MVQNFSDWYVIEVNGVDAIKYLQGQLPINLLKLANYRSIFSFLSLPTGRVLGIYRLIKLTDEKILLVCYQKDNCDRIFNHLKKFSVFSKVTITSLNAFVCATTSFEQLKEFKNKQAELKEYDDQALKFTDLSSDVSVVINAGAEIYKVISGNTTMYISTNEFNVNFDDYEEELTVDQFFSLSALAGYNYKIDENLTNKYLPQAFGIDNNLESAISYTKGCYQGQEGIAKAKYRGANPYACYKFILNISDLSPVDQEVIVNNINNLDSEIFQTLSLEVNLEADKFKKSGDIFNLFILDNSQKIYHDLPVGKFIVLTAIISKKLLPNEFSYHLVLGNNKHKLTLIAD